jgi:Mg2+ and Co2+ transporter CorA
MPRQNCTVPDRFRLWTPDGWREDRSDFYTFDPLEEFEWLSSIGASAIKQEPYLLVGRLLQLATVSLAKVIHEMEEDVAFCQQAEATESAAASTQLEFKLGLLDPLRTYVADNLSIVEGQTTLHHLSTFTDLKKDLDYLLVRIGILSNRCDTIADTLMSTMSILESQKSIEQSQQVNKLTKPAFVYIPLSFISSMFGMNVTELENNPPIWIFFLTGFFFTFLSVCVASWQDVKRRGVILRQISMNALTALLLILCKLVRCE